MIKHTKFYIPNVYEKYHNFVNQERYKVGTQKYHRPGKFVTVHKHKGTITIHTQEYKFLFISSNGCVTLNNYDCEKMKSYLKCEVLSSTLEAKYLELLDKEIERLEKKNKEKQKEETMTTNKEFTIKVKNYEEKEIKALYEKCLKLEGEKGEVFRNNVCNYYIRIVPDYSPRHERSYRLLNSFNSSYCYNLHYNNFTGHDNVMLSLFEALVDLELEKQQFNIEKKKKIVTRIENLLNNKFSRDFSDEEMYELFTEEDYKFYCDNYAYLRLNIVKKESNNS